MQVGRGKTLGVPGLTLQLCTGWRQYGACMVAHASVCTTCLVFPIASRRRAQHVRQTADIVHTQVPLAGTTICETSNPTTVDTRHCIHEPHTASTHPRKRIPQTREPTSETHERHTIDKNRRTSVNATSLGTLVTRICVSEIR